ncbi:MAG: translation elongation factor Ts [Candidatus Omnitrophica bacterium]|nr:translation elongation factor Ts [Candidatus Omnitrophota bacterium]
MALSVDVIKELRRITSASIAECQKALTETNGDIEKAQELLRKRGLEIAAKKVGKSAKDGRVEAYVHMGNKIGVLVEVNSETDFVARNNEFIQFTKDVAMQITACSPSYVKREDVPSEVIEKENDKDKFYKEHCLLEQPFIKDPGMTMKDYLGNLVGKMGENIVIRRFSRFQLGE